MQALRALFVFLLAKSTSGQFPTEDGVIDWYDNIVHSIGKDGNAIWKFDAGSFVEAAALGNDGTFYAGIQNGTFIALTSDGIVKWKFTAPACTGLYESCYGQMGLAGDGTILLSARGCVFPCFDKPVIMYALSPHGELAWSATAGCTEVVSHGHSQFVPWTWMLGKEASQGLLFTVTTCARASVNALATSDGSTKWSIAMDDHALPYVDVAADGSLLALVGDTPYYHDDPLYNTSIAAYTMTGHLRWNHSLPNGLGAYGSIYRMTPGANGDVYVSAQLTSPANGTSQLSTHSQLIAFTGNGEKKWNVSTPNVTFSYPSEQSSMGDVFVTTWKQWENTSFIMAVHPDGSQSTFHEFPFLPPASCLWDPVLAPDDSLYLPSPVNAFNAMVYVLTSNGDEKSRFKSQFRPVFANDGTAYIRKWVPISLYNLTYSLLAVDANTGSVKWEYVFNPAARESLMLV